ncbi:MAG: branched-chain amino acid ABC transporter permease [Thermincolia bacterium]
MGLTDTVYIYVGINIILALSLYITLSTGQISLGQGAFMGIGAYTAGVLTVKMGWPLLLAMVVAAVFTAGVGIAVGFPALRLRGIYLGIATLGIGEMVRVFLNNFHYTGALEGFSGMSGTSMWLVYLMVVLCILFTWRLTNSRLGWAFKAVHEDEIAAQTMGLNITYVKLTAFGISAAMAALAGGLYGHFMYYIHPENFGFHTSLLILFYVIFGGVATYWGAVIGAAILTVLPEYIRELDQWRMVVYGIIIIIMMIVRPEGLISGSTMAKGKKLMNKIGFKWMGTGGVFAVNSLVKAETIKQVKGVGNVGD